MGRVGRDCAMACYGDTEKISPRFSCSVEALAIPAILIAGGESIVLALPPCAYRAASGLCSNCHWRSVLSGIFALVLRATWRAFEPSGYQVV